MAKGVRFTIVTEMGTKHVWEDHVSKENETLELFKRDNTEVVNKEYFTDRYVGWSVKNI